MSVQISDLASAIVSSLEEYSEDVEDMMKDEIDKLSKAIKENLSSNPKIPVKTGEYRKSFKIKKISDGRGYKRNKIYNKKYQITHLLERGYVVPSTGKRTKAYPHWEDAQKLADALPENIARRLEQK